jgi:hypothetical protein
MKAASLRSGNVVDATPNIDSSTAPAASDLAMVQFVFVEHAAHPVIGCPFQDSAVRRRPGGSAAFRAAAVSQVSIVARVKHHDDTGLPGLEAPTRDAPLLNVPRTELVDVGMPPPVPSTASSALTHVEGIVHVATPRATPGATRAQTPALSDTPLSFSSANQARQNFSQTDVGRCRFARVSVG